MRLDREAIDVAEPVPAPVRDDRSIVAMRGITKRFGPVVANSSVDFDLSRGEIHALLGENGAGKTTLMNVLSGLLQPDSGQILIAGRPVRMRSALDAISMGIGMVHQHSELVPILTVAENMVLGERAGVRLRRSDLARVAETIAELGARHGLEVSPDALVWQLSVGERQRAEILRALYRNAHILILDEPTANLTPTEVESLLEKLRTMARSGASIVLITHHLDEVMACADRITVLREGCLVAVKRPEETSTRELARLMVGRDVSLDLVASARLDERRATDGPGQPSASPAGRPALEVEGVTAVSDRGTIALRGIDLEIHPGEILAIAGVEGNGQAELEEVLCGLRPASSGTIVVDGEEVTGLGPAELFERGVGFVPSDRYRRGLVAALSVADNLVIDRVHRPPIGRPLWVDRKALLAHALELIRRFSIRVASPSQPAGTLSGGNAQRVVLARALGTDLKLLLAAQPSRGLDVGATEFVWEQLRAQREQGVAILLVSTDLDEVFALADRAHVIYRGQLVGHWFRTEFDREEIGLAMGGVGRPSTARGGA